MLSLLLRRPLLLNPKSPFDLLVYLSDFSGSYLQLLFGCPANHSHKSTRLCLLSRTFTRRAAGSASSWQAGSVARCIATTISTHAEFLPKHSINIDAVCTVGDQPHASAAAYCTNPWAFSIISPVLSLNHPFLPNFCFFHSRLCGSAKASTRQQQQQLVLGVSEQQMVVLGTNLRQTRGLAIISLQPS